MLTPTKPVKSCECSGSCGDCCCCTKESIGLGNVDNTSDLNKPLSRDMVNALSGKVDLNIFTQLKNRVLALENTITEIPDLKVRISECELDIKDHYEAIKRLQSTTKSMANTITELGNRVTGVNDGLVTVGTRVDALETKDSNNVKLSGVNVQTIQGTLKANDPATGVTDKTLVTANWVSQSGNKAPNNLLHKNGNERKSGELELTDLLTFKSLNKDDTNNNVGYFEFPNLHIDDKNGLRVGSIWFANNYSVKSMQFRRGYNYNGRKNCDLQLVIDESKGVIVFAINWGDGTVTEIARHNL